MRTVYKYDITRGYAEIPTPFKVRKVGYQAMTLCLWAEVDTKNSPRRFEFFAVPTGGTVPEIADLEYLDTVFEGAFVWHIYYVNNQ